MVLASDATKATAPAVLAWSPDWAVAEIDGGLVLSAGPDRLLALDGVPPEAAHFIAAWPTAGVDTGGHPALPQVANQLLDLGAITARGAAPVSVSLDSTWGFGGVLATELARIGCDVGSSPTALRLAIRHGAAYPEPPDGPHLLVDVALDHTLVLGPLVLPGLTSCIECLRVRVERRWPTQLMPAAPRMQTRPALVAELIMLQARLFAAGTSPLVNATNMWNFESGASTRERLLKVPDCMRCADTTPIGRVHLPWIDS